MEHVLIVAATDQSAGVLKDLVNAETKSAVTVLSSCAQARRLLVEQDFDLVIINAPLRDETGEDFACHVVSRGLAQAILVVEATQYEAISAATESEGVLTVSKPLNRAIFWSALKLARATVGRLRRMHQETVQLKEKMADIRILNRAKYILISQMGLSEDEAHRYLEKQAMDLRQSKRSVAEGILRTYEN